MVNEPYEYGGDVPDEIARTWVDPELRRGAFQRLAEWSRAYAPTAVSADELLAAMPGPGHSEPTEAAFFGSPGELWLELEGVWSWTFAEDGLR